VAIIKIKVKVSPVNRLAILFLWFVLTLVSCNNKRHEIVISDLEQTNALIKRIDIHTPVTMSVYIRYWKTGHQDSVFITPFSKRTLNHHFILTGLQPLTNYTYQIISTIKNTTVKTERNFTTKHIPLIIQEMVNLAYDDTPHLPEKFQKGYVMVYRRDVPGILMIVNAKGQIVWYKEADSTGFKVAAFTKQNNILALMAPMTYPTSYSNEILELSLNGDTLLDLKKGEKGFTETAHHEILLNDSGHLVTITLEERPFDLSKIGGTKNDTVSGDGILVMDKNGNRLWHWSVFDTINVLKIPDILKKKKDLMHGNSLTYDNDGNYLLSYYNTGQIWKINSKTGKVIWKFGRGGDFKINNPKNWFQQSHDIQKVNGNELLLFENGTDDQTTRILTYRLNEQAKTTSLVKEITLPKNLYTPKMGSAYYINDSTALACSAQTGEVVLINDKGKILWRLRTPFRPYRAAFIPSDSLHLWNLERNNN
jgi:outer membrane protein assembly factor BamB